jgi:hypothetical protein
MLVFIWFCVMTQAFAPGGQRLADAAVSSVQTHIREQVEGFAPTPNAPRITGPRSRALAR